MSIAALIRQMAEAGATSEVIALAVEAVEAERARDDERKAKQRDRTRRHREGKRYGNVTETSLSQHGNGDSLPPKETPPTPPKEITPNPCGDNTAREARPDLKAEFAEFWTEFPAKKGKPKAEEAFRKARKIASHEAIMAGVRRYVAELSRFPDRSVKWPQGWLNDQRWQDEPEAERIPQPSFRIVGGQSPPKPKTQRERMYERMMARGTQ